MSSFPACKHQRRRSHDVHCRDLRWLAGEPYRLFFASGALWSIIGVSLWPLYYAQQLGYYPGFAHARLMIEAFGGAFVVGFLGTAGPRMATAPKLTPAELVLLFLLHQASAFCHLSLQHAWGDRWFAALLVTLLTSLIVRVLRFRKESLPPQMLLALTGLVCGSAGAMMMTSPHTQMDPVRLRIAQLLLYQGFLLPPVLGIGSFVFPRMLGADFGGSGTSAQTRASLRRAITVTLLLPASFWLEAQGSILMGYTLRFTVSLGYLLREVCWRAHRGGSLTTGLFWSLGTGATGLALAGWFYPQHVSVEHLLYIGGFGMIMLIVGSRVLFGHSGDLEGFFIRSKWVRFLIFLGVLAAITRATPAWVPSTTVSHHIYAAVTWALLGLCWLLWHRRRFVKRDEED